MQFSFASRLITAATAIAVAAGLWAAAPAAAGGAPAAGAPKREGPAGPPALMPSGRVATPPTVRVPQISQNCPIPPYGAQFYAPSVPGYAKTVALTFDDGPGTTTTRQILHILRAYKVRATFFDLGQNIAANPAVAREQASYGYPIGNHTWSHPDMTKLSRARQAAQMDEEAAKQRAVIGTSPCLFRPPFGAYNATTLQLAKYRRMAVWLWSVDTEDWKAAGSSSPYWVNRIIRLAEQEGIALHHPVILMHNQPAGNPATVLALPAILKYFRQHHYLFVKLS